MRLPLAVLSLLVPGRRAFERQPGAAWDWNDGASGEIGLASRADFATELFSFDFHMVAWKVHLHVPPAIQRLEDAAELMDSAAVKLKVATTAADGKQDAEEALERLRPLVAPKTFSTQFQGSRPARNVASWAGRPRKPSKKDRHPPPFHTDCRATVEADGGAVPLIERELSDLDDPAEEPYGAGEFAEVLTCLARQARAHADAMRQHRYGKSRSIGLHPEGWPGLMKAFIANMDAIHANQKAAGWDWAEDHTRQSFNAPTRALLERLRALRLRFVAALQLRGVGPLPPGGNSTALDAARQTLAALDEMNVILVRKCRFSDSDCGAVAGGSKTDWLPAASTARAAWDSDDGFAHMKHSCVLYGDEADCSIFPDPLHQYLLRLYGTYFERVFLVAKQLDVVGQLGTGRMAAIKDEVTSAGLSLSDRGGQLHFAQLHGNRIRTAEKLQLSRHFPQPIRGALADIELTLPYVRRTANDVTDVERQFGEDCGRLSKRFANVVRMWDVYMSNLSPPNFIYRKGKRTKRVWSWTTSPSVWIFTTQSKPPSSESGQPDAEAACVRCLCPWSETAPLQTQAHGCLTSAASCSGAWPAALPLDLRCPTRLFGRLGTRTASSAQRSRQAATHSTTWCCAMSPLASEPSTDRGSVSSGRFEGLFANPESLRHQIARCLCRLMVRSHALLRARPQRWPAGQQRPLPPIIMRSRQTCGARTFETPCSATRRPALRTARRRRRRTARPRRRRRGRWRL